jgi:hypothetical protein
MIVIRKTRFVILMGGNCAVIGYESNSPSRGTETRTNQAAPENFIASRILSNMPFEFAGVQVHANPTETVPDHVEIPASRNGPSRLLVAVAALGAIGQRVHRQEAAAAGRRGLVLLSRSHGLLTNPFCMQGASLHHHRVIDRGLFEPDSWLK